MTAPDVLTVIGEGPLATVHGLAAEAVGLSAPATLVVSSVRQHGSLVLDALASGQAVLVEKPLAATVREATAIETADTGHRLLYGENLAHSPVVRLALEHIDRMRPLTYVEVRSLSARTVDGDHDPFDLDAQAIALALLIAGDDPPVDLRGAHPSFDLVFASGLIAHIETGNSEHTAVWDLQASSNSGVVRAEVFPTCEVEVDGEPIPLPPVPEGIDPRLITMGYVEQMRELDRVANGGEPWLGAAFGRLVVELLVRSRV